MTTSPSTPRIRVTQLWYVIVLILVALSERGAANARVWFELPGFILMMMAALGRVWTSAHIAGYKDKRLITTGPYSACRHPLYAFSLLGGLGVGLLTRSVVITAATMLVLGVLHFVAIRREERLLLRLHGESFLSYCKRVPPLLPSWSQYQDHAESIVDLRVFRKSFLDAGTYMLLYALIVLLDASRMAGLWPTFFHLW